MLQKFNKKKILL